MLHTLLERQLRKAGLSNENLPNSLENWQKLLNKINSTYIQNDNDHYLLQRSLQISSQEMLGRWMELQESNQRKQVIFDSALDSLVISKVDGTITEYNITAKNTFHWFQSDSVGKNIKEFISYENRELDLTELFLAPVMNGKIDQKKIFKAEMLGKKQTNEKFPIETYYVPINFKRETVYLWYIRDLTSQKEYEAIIEMQQLNLISASKLATLGEMAANIAHEINNPLTTIKIITELVRRSLSRDNPQIEDSIN
ncbi:MAG: histidine kinase dimerization/phospho-acceptor domain-containing protein, partial [Bacteriovorax sp.]|nr:histidine kinase dimerization/phospho-acceptor domain-containing protein [Bacteriovorax sp.]